MAMTARERVLGSLNREGYDRIPIKHVGTPEIDSELMAHFQLREYEELLRIVGDDFRYVNPRYIGPELKTYPDGSWDGIFGERYKNIAFEGGVYPEAVYLPFEGIEDVRELDGIPSPSADWFDYASVPEQCEQFGNYALIVGDPGTPDFINGIARCRGVEQVILDIGLESPVFLELVEQRFYFFYEKLERTLRAAAGRVDIVHFGEDLGTQNGPLISPSSFERLFADRYKAFFNLAHKYGARTMMHSCGSVYRFIPRLIELGLDILDVIQVQAADMAIDKLAEEFGDQLAFCGSMCVQSFLHFGTVEDVRREVDHRLDLFPKGGLILGPSHAIQVGTPLDNILEMYRRAGSLAR